MTNYNERLDKILGQLITKTADASYGEWQVVGLPEAKQALTSLIKELVEEAKPTEKPTDDTKIGSWEEGHQNVGYNRAVIEFEQNLLKELEEV